jgi:predicted nucleic acid-binding protein
VSEIFADSFFFIALLNPSDQHHAAAVAASSGLAAPLVTTEPVLIELADALSAPANRSRAAAFCAGLAEDPGVRVVPLDSHTFGRGLELYSRRPDKEWSLTDCISFVVMGDRGITEAMTGDHHFEQAGFVALLRPR